MGLILTFFIVWCMLATCINTESQNFNDKRLLITDPDYADNQQIKRDIQLMKATMSQLQTTVNTLNAKVIGQDKQIQSQNIHIQNQDRQIQSQHTQIQSQKMQIQNQDRQIQKHNSVITSFQNSNNYSHYLFIHPYRKESYFFTSFLKITKLQNFSNNNCSIDP